MSNQYSIHLISNDPSKIDDIQESIKPETLLFFDGTGFDSFSKLINSCIANANTEIVIILSDKVRPTAYHIQKIINLISHGYAFVGLYRFACFGIKKEVLRRIGFFDERYVGGGFEDYDFIVRLIENDLAVYVDESVKYIPSPSKWANDDGEYPGYDHWCQKWNHFWQDGNPVPVKLERTMAEEDYSYDLGPPVTTVFLSCNKYAYENSISNHLKPFFYMEITSNSKLRYSRIKGIEG